MTWPYQYRPRATTPAVTGRNQQFSSDQILEWQPWLHCREYLMKRSHFVTKQNSICLTWSSLHISRKRERHTGIKSVVCIKQVINYLFFKFHPNPFNSVCVKSEKVTDIHRPSILTYFRIFDNKMGSAKNRLIEVLGPILFKTKNVSFRIWPSTHTFQRQRVLYAIKIHKYKIRN